MYTHILLPTNGSPRSDRAVKAGIQLAKGLGAKVTGLYVAEATYVSVIDEQTKIHTDEVFSEFSRQATSLGVTYDCVAIEGSSPQDAILKFAKENACGLIVMGTHGRSRVGKFLMGSIAASLLADSDIPVLLCR